MSEVTGTKQSAPPGFIVVDGCCVEVEADGKTIVKRVQPTR